MVVCLSPNQIYLEETLNSISYAEKAKKIKPVHARQNVIVTPEEIFKRRIMELEKENSNLRKLLLEKVSEGLSRYTDPPKPKPRPQDSKPQPRRPAYTLAELREDIENIATAANNIARTESSLQNLQADIRDNRQAVEDLQQVAVTEKNEARQAVVYKELRLVAESLEDCLGQQDGMVVEEKRLRDELRAAKVKVLDNYQAMMLFCERIDGNFERNESRSQSKVTEYKGTAGSWKDAKEIDDLNTDVSWMKEELLKKEEQINELTKALKHLAKIPSSPQLGGLSRMGLDNVLADISSIRYDPKLILFTSDFTEIEKKASNIKSKCSNKPLPDLIAKISQVLDPTTKASEGNFGHIEELNHSQDKEIELSKNRFDRTYSHPGFGTKGEKEHYGIGGSVDEMLNIAHKEEYDYESDLDDSNINPLSLADENNS